MEEEIKLGDCVRIPDGRIARVRATNNRIFRVCVRRKTSQIHQFLDFSEKNLNKETCPKGWMSPQGYSRYLKNTLKKMQARLQQQNH